MVWLVFLKYLVCYGDRLQGRPEQKQGEPLGGGSVIQQERVAAQTRAEVTDGEKWMHWGRALEVELMDFANRLYGED